MVEISLVDNACDSTLVTVWKLVGLNEYDMKKGILGLRTMLDIGEKLMS